MDLIRGTITSISPLQVTYLGDTVPVDVSGAFAAVSMGGRVLVAVQGTDRIIVAQANSGMVGYTQLEPASDLIVGTSPSTVAGLQLTGMPTGIPVLMELVVTAVNAQSGGDRSIVLQLVNGSTNVGPSRAYELPYVAGRPNPYSIVHRVPVTNPGSGSWTVKASADQASSVLIWHASLRLDYLP